ncbi:MAG TPA: MFS transporter [Ktedonosporobacter sp.]|jgi:MFS family permease|nr:MFS transporter [Ktedonosporobacter sp.]
MNNSIEEKQSSTAPLLQEQRNAPWPIYALFTGNVVSYIGDVLTLLAIPWFVLQTTGSVKQAGITGFFSALPMVLSGFLGSVLVDRLGYKRTSVIGDVLSGITVMLVPLLYHTIGLAFWQLLFLVFIGGLLKSPAMTARSAMVPDLAKLARMRLERANAWDDGVQRVSRFFGAPLAGVLIAVIGTSNLLWLDAASFAFSALLIGLTVPEVAPVSKQESAKAEQQSYFTLLREGVHFLIRDSVILTIIIVVVVTNLLDDANISVVEPAYIMQTFHSALPLGLLIAASGGMAFIGTIIFGSIGHRLPRRLTFGVGFTIGGALRFWVLLIPILPFMLGWFALAGLAIAPINALISTVLQERTPPEMRARVFGTLGAAVLAGIPLGTLASGFVVTWLGLRTTLFIMGLLYLMATLSILVNPALKSMEKSPSSN